MPLVTQYQAVKDVYREASERRVALPVFCCEDRETLEAVLAAAEELGRELGVDDLPITPAWTGRYPARPQLKLLTACGDAVLANQLMLSDLDAFMGETSPYRKLRVLPHLDHAFPWMDGDLLDNFVDRFASVMCDASEKPFEENVRLTAEYVEKVRGRVVVEGAVDEIFEPSGAEKNTPTSVEQAVRFLRETGVDILVPNVGTEHRAAGKQARYLPEHARKISAAVGKILGMHGASSVPPADLPGLPDDGFIKVNIFTTLAVSAGQAVARQVLDNVGNVFTRAQVEELVAAGVLSAAVLEDGYGETRPPIGPKLIGAATGGRRDVWFATVKRRCIEFLKTFNYAAFAG